jgi:hypothetical protein
VVISLLWKEYASVKIDKIDKIDKIELNALGIWPVWKPARDALARK